MFSPAIPYVAPTKMLDMVAHLGLSSGLKLCLDPGDPASFAAASDQQWSDVSGQGTHFYRGATSGSEASDPTFSGNIGGQSAAELFTLDGGDYFTMVGSNPTFLADAHKNNAQFAALMWVYLGNVVTDAQTFLATYARGNVTTRGFGFFAISADLKFQVDDGAVFAGNFGSSLAVGWNLIGVTLNEATGANGGHMRVNGTTQVLNSTYTAPSTSAATSRLFIGANTSTNFKMSNGGKMGAVLLWDRVLSIAETGAFYQATRGRYGI